MDLRDHQKQSYLEIRSLQTPLKSCYINDCSHLPPHFYEEIRNWAKPQKCVHNPCEACTSYKHVDKQNPSTIFLKKKKKGDCGKDISCQAAIAGNVLDAFWIHGHVLKVTYGRLILTYNFSSKLNVAKILMFVPLPPISSSSQVTQVCQPSLAFLLTPHVPVPCGIVLGGHFLSQGPHYKRFSVFIYGCIRYTLRGLSLHYFYLKVLVPVVSCQEWLLSSLELLLHCSVHEVLLLHSWVYVCSALMLAKKLSSQSRSLPTLMQCLVFLTIHLRLNCGVDKNASVGVRKIWISQSLLHHLLCDLGQAT